MQPCLAASPGLAQAALAGTIAPTGRLEIFGADGITVVTTYDFTMALVSSLATGTATACTSALPVDELSLSVASLTAS